MPDDVDLLAGLKPRRHAVAVVAFIQKHPKWKAGAEIGIAQGRTSLAILKSCPGLRLIGVDPFRYIEDSENSGLYKDFDFAHNEACVRAVAAKYPDRYRVMKMTSAEAAAQIPDASLDFVFIDANHMYAECRADILAWRPKVRPGGWVAGHDYSKAWPGVIRAVDELLGKPMQFDNAVWAVERKAES